MLPPRSIESIEHLPCSIFMSFILKTKVILNYSVFISLHMILYKLHIDVLLADPYNYCPSDVMRVVAPYSANRNNIKLNFVGQYV